MLNRPEYAKLWAEIVAKAWMDEGFKKQLLANPEKVLKEYGIDLSGLKCKVIENTENTIHLILPQKPEEHLSQHDLKKIAAAGCRCTKDNPCG